jgi:two-component system, OmpR family, response regulator
MSNADYRVLLVEDSVLLSERLMELISDIDGIATVAMVTTEHDAIQAIQTHHPDAIILDLRLKEGTGFGVMRYVNTLSSRPQAVVMTNYALPQYRKQAEALGVRYFLDKSQEFDRLPDILGELRDERGSTTSH